MARRRRESIQASLKRLATGRSSFTDRDAQIMHLSARALHNWIATRKWPMHEREEAMDAARRIEHLITKNEGAI
jgi:hypothetical protein